MDYIRRTADLGKRLLQQERFRGIVFDQQNMEGLLVEELPDLNMFCRAA